jgi:hypothetical protein
MSGSSVIAAMNQHPPSAQMVPDVVLRFGLVLVHVDRDR